MDDRYAVVDTESDEVLGLYGDADEAIRKSDNAEDNGFETTVFRVSFHEVDIGDAGEAETVETSDKPETDDGSYDSLAEAVSSIPDADLDTLETRDDGTGSFVIRCDEEEVDYDLVESRLNEMGYERTGVFAIPNRVKQKFGPADGETDG